MNKPINKTCPHCQQPFEARRKNQRYCTEECRQDANNAVAKVRYASFRQDAPKLKVLQKQVKNLKEELAFLIGVISGVKVSEENTLPYKGSRYKRGNQMDRTGTGVMLDKGGALLRPGNKIIYRTTSNVKAIYMNTCLIGSGRGC